MTKLMRAVVMMALVAMLGAGSGCSGCAGDVGRYQAGICDRETECPRGQVYRKGVCAQARCDSGDSSNPDKDCCPGQFCRLDGTCVDKPSQNTCTQDADCGGAGIEASGQICMSRPELSTDGKVCSFPFPSADGECPVTYRLFNKRCIKALPCEGGCGDGELCNIETDECEKIPTIPTADSGCEVSCASGTIKVLADPDGMSFNQCCAIACQCASLPPLAEGVYGRYADAAVASGGIVVASYNETYGDLVVSTHDKSTGKVTALEFVDGAPSDGQLSGDPTGPRNGFGERGPDVGLFASIAIAGDGSPRVIYFDADNKDLKYAERTGSTWTSHVIESAGDVGRYATLEYSNGKLRAAYFVSEGQSTAGAGAGFTGLRYAESKVANPASASDWKLIDAVPFQPVRKVCGGQCQPTQACVRVTTPTPAFVCATRDVECSGTQAEGQTCASVNGAKAFYDEDPVSQVVELPEGPGLFPSMAVSGDRLLIAYYDNYTPQPAPDAMAPFVRLPGKLKGVIAQLNAGSAGAFSAPVVLDNGQTCDGKVRDVGRFPSLAIAQNGRVGVSYIDATRQELRYYGAGAGETFLETTGCFDTTQTKHMNNRVFIADTGVDTANPGVTFVGADSSLYFGSNSRPHIAYQDQSNLDVRLSSMRSDESWTPTLLTQDSGDGFEVQLLSEGSTIWLMSVKLGFDNIGNSNTRIGVRTVTLPSVP